MAYARSLSTGSMTHQTAAWTLQRISASMLHHEAHDAALGKNWTLQRYPANQRKGLR